LTDIDLDCLEAITAAPYFLPDTAVFGHESKPTSHYVYKTNLYAAKTKAAIKLRSVDKFGILEIRTGGGDAGAQTVFPPSIHISGEPITWENADFTITEIDGAELLDRAYQLAVAIQLAKAYPEIGARHDAAFVLGGFLSRCTLAISIEDFVAAVADASGQDDDKRQDMIRTALDGANVELRAGFPNLAETFGNAEAEKCAEWLDYTSDNEPSPSDDWEAPNRCLIPFCR
jgi:hypothetical protein